jgi:hypothetical protein
MTHFRFFLVSLLILVASTYMFIKYPSLQTNPVQTIETALN